MPIQRYVIITLLAPLKDGDEFLPENYPLHITIVPGFQLGTIDGVLLKKIRLLCSTTDPFTLTAGKDEFFGLNNEVTVTTMIMNGKLRKLHNSLVEILSASGATFDEPQYMLDNYRAHATVQNTARLHNGDAVTIKSITIIDKLPDGNPNKRRLLKTLYLSKQ